MATPELSIVIAAQGDAAETARCLGSLSAQKDVSAADLEIIVVHESRSAGVVHEARSAGVPPAPDLSSELQSQFPSVRFLRSKSSSVPRLHGLGIENANGNLVALSEGHCTFAQDWAQTAIAAHRQHAEPVIGGSVALGQELDHLNLGLFLCDYAQFLPPLEPVRTHDLPGNNVVFKQTALPARKSLPEKGFWKTFYCASLESKGALLLSQPSMRVFYNRRLTVPQIIERRYNHGRCFGGMRAAQASPFQRLAYFVLGPAICALIFWKFVRRCSSKPQCRELLLQGLPGAMICILFWSLGEWIGNMAGTGLCCDKL